MKEDSEPVERVHSEAPAEGDETADASELRFHSQDPAEGADFQDEGSAGDSSKGS
ncbi:hypothetical protein [Arthrobacter sp. 92]|jgi:hypothetical protein|uniref:hypothetical protein n=1 Tax=Arthrobacter sp. 92 TaxID=3418175 RepID=UPI0006A84BFC|nr:hypothetical protein AHiyo6_15440 [Arthrobacter sp. Hiyo6]